MTNWTNIKKIRFNIHKSFLIRTFREADWISKTGQQILRECRDLDHPITNTTFYKIRREIMSHIDIEPEPEFSMSRAEFAGLTELLDVSIEELVDRAIKNIRASDKKERKK